MPLYLDDLGSQVGGAPCHPAPGIRVSMDEIARSEPTYERAQRGEPLVGWVAVIVDAPGGCVGEQDVECPSFEKPVGEEAWAHAEDVPPDLPVGVLEGRARSVAWAALDPAYEETLGFHDAAMSVYAATRCGEVDSIGHERTIVVAVDIEEGNVQRRHDELQVVIRQIPTREHKLDIREALADGFVVHERADSVADHQDVHGLRILSPARARHQPEHWMRTGTVPIIAARLGGGALGTAKRRVLVCSAWPYASGVLHLGNLVGCLLSGCVFKRFFRLRGCDALHVSGTDAHGTHIEFEAIRQGMSPHELANRVHLQIVEVLDAFEIDIDNYTITETPVHKEFVTEIYRQMDAAGYILSQEEERAFCRGCQRFLADRYIVGTCPRCAYAAAKGNQCDACGSLLEPEELQAATCAFCGSRDIVRRKTRHWYLDLAKLEPQLKDYVRNRRFQGNVAEFSQRMLDEGLRPRAVTRDIAWGIPAPFPGAEGKVIYVWAEAALGYVSATIEHFRRVGLAERWKEFWFGEDIKQVYTQGKDNIPFHTLIFPGQLVASEQGYHLPDQISATEYLNWIGGEQFSKSRGVGIYADEALELLPPVYWRFYLLYNRPEGRDTSFSWEEFDKAVNGILVNNIANFVHRVLSFVWSRHGGRVPDVPTDAELSAAIGETIDEVVRVIESGALAPALRRIAGLAVLGNEYFQRRAPWREGDEAAVASAAHLVKTLAVLLDPFVPMFSRAIYEVMGIAEPVLEEARRSPAGTRLVRQPRPLLEHVDIKELQERYHAMKEADMVSLEEFAKIELRVGRIVHAEAVPGADKLLRLEIDLGARKAQAVAGIRAHYDPAELKGRLVTVVANLKPATIRGIKSECMLLAAQGETLSLIGPEGQVEPGAKIS